MLICLFRLEQTIFHEQNDVNLPLQPRRPYILSMKSQSPYTRILIL